MYGEKPDDTTNKDNVLLEGEAELETSRMLVVY